MYEERAARLDGAVVWTRAPASGDGAARPPEPYAVLPDGCMDLMWCDGRLLVAGPDTRAFVPENQAAHYAGVRFAPGDAPALLGVPARELRDRRIGLGALWGEARARRLGERIAEASDPAAALEELVLRRALEVPAPDPLLRAVVRRLNAGRPVAETAEAVGIGSRQLHRRSLDAFGYGPKTLARVLRLQRALALVRAGLPYTEAALRAGCSDQAHLARETRTLAGTTLTAYAAAWAKRETPQPSGSSTTA
ncbi:MULTISPECIES: helix-turn-helix domain-containing protein [Streptomyces]|uniref:helix-turn-helix domain-containing protein n=1 Tax=Streptomyces TaxID=1883 RepID=UPI001318F6D1|nr:MULTISPECIES: helix-turn-helix domain-containing protein [Streptomyces]QGZ51601.1 helix-turn-helix domain-containing protein [Streptomyces sp. QHH-9511]GGT98722.1 AraC family transcriptional regulator [Streptomyces lateritius]